jgi:hypothetical protein
MSTGGVVLDGFRLLRRPGAVGLPCCSLGIEPLNPISSSELHEQPFVLLEYELRKMDWLTVYLTAGLSTARLLIQQRSPSIESSHQEVPQTHHILRALGSWSPSGTGMRSGGFYSSTRIANLGRQKSLIESEQRIFWLTLDG